MEWKDNVVRYSSYRLQWRDHFVDFTGWKQWSILVGFICPRVSVPGCHVAIGEVINCRLVIIHQEGMETWEQMKALKTLFINYATWLLTPQEIAMLASLVGMLTSIISVCSRVLLAPWISFTDRSSVGFGAPSWPSIPSWVLLARSQYIIYHLTNSKCDPSLSLKKIREIAGFSKRNLRMEG